MPCCHRALVSLFLFVTFSNFGASALRCRLYHRIWEDGHILKINPDVCHTSARYCVRATYSDPDERKKNGYSMGCDKVDCQGIDNPNFTGWQQKDNGEYCRKSRDYGKKGEICCCSGDMCNFTQRTSFAVLTLISTIFTVYIF